MQYHALALADERRGCRPRRLQGRSPPEGPHRTLARGRAPARRGAVALPGQLAIEDHLRAALPRSTPCARATGCSARCMRIPPARSAARPDAALDSDAPSRLARCRGVRGARLVLDWHNLGYSILALRLGRRHLAVRMARWLEQHTGRRAHAHLCVSRGFARFLADRFKIRDVRVLVRSAGVRLRSGGAHRAGADSGRRCSRGWRSAEQAPWGSSCAPRAGRRTRISTS